MKTIKIFLVFAFIISMGIVSAQKSYKNYQFDTTSTYLIILNDGSELVSKVIYNDTSVIKIKTAFVDELTLPIKNIKNVEKIKMSAIKKGNIWFENPNSTRYLFSPSAFNLKKGEGYYQNTYLILNSFNYGVTNNISIGGGLEFISTFTSLASGPFNPIFYITPKVGFKASEKIGVGAGIWYARIPSIDTGGFAKSQGAGIPYIISTYGNMDDNVTVGMGWSFVKDKFSKMPIFTFSGMKRISKKTALITENWIVYLDYTDTSTEMMPGGTMLTTTTVTKKYYPVYSYGVRFFGEKLAVDLALVNTSDVFKVMIIGVPFVNFVVKF